MTSTRAFEAWWPLVAACLVVALWWLTGTPFPEKPEGLFGAAATVASVFASFLGVSKAIILSIKNSEVYKLLVKTGHTDALFGHLKSGIFTSVVFAGLSILGFFISPDRLVYGHKLFQIFEFFWILFAALSLFTYLRISNILFKLLKSA